LGLDYFDGGRIQAGVIYPESWIEKEKIDEGLSAKAS